MKFSSLISLVLLPVAALAAKKSTGSSDPFTTFHKRQLSNSGPVQLDDNTIAQLTKTPRNYTSAVLFTAVAPKFGCKLCQDYQPEWELLVKSWINGDKEGASKLVFGTLDFVDGKSTFQAMNLMTAPILFLYQPTVGPNAKTSAEPMRFEFNSGPQDAETTHRWIARQMPNSPVHPPVARPFNKLRAFVITTLALAGTAFTTVAYPYVVPLLSNRTLWAVISVLTILLFTSGHMFNHIRGAPYMARSQSGGLSIFANGFQSQFGLESQLIAGIYAVLAFSTVALASKVPRMRDPKAQQVAVFVWCGVSLIAYSWLMSIFRLKNGGYPFWLPPF